ncbi:MAG: PQQ-binding-like beta-propeller repeat protein [Treponema sp.]|nr:PQQ-binding-like beta-propeller repeat protein [Treponema sp.]
MKIVFVKCVFFLFTAGLIFSQSVEREQGLVTAEPFWRQALGGEVIALPHVQAQSAVVVLDGGNIRAYSTAGTPMWNYSARGRISPYVTRSREGTSYFTRTNGTLIAVNRAGRELWRRDIGQPLCARVVTGWDGRLFVPTSGRILCFTASGNLLWSKELSVPFLISPVQDRFGGIIFALENNEVHRIDPFGNINIWALTNTPAFVVPLDPQRRDDGSQLTIPAPELQRSGHRIMVIYTNGSIEILGAPAGDWFISSFSDMRSSILTSLPSRPISAAGMGNNAAVLLDDGKVSMFSIEERSIIWTGITHIREMMNLGRSAVLDAQIIFDERGVYVLSINGATAFTHEGRRLWFSYLENAAAIPAFGNDGVLYSGGRDWILYAYRIESRVLPQRNALYGPVPDGSYGLGRPYAFYELDIPLNETETISKVEYIGAAVNSGSLGENEPSWTSFILTQAASRGPIQLRINALNILGKIGSQETIPWLINIYNRENEPSIKSAAVKAIGDIGVDPEGTALRTFLFAILQGGIREEQVLSAIASSTGAICRFSGPPMSGMGIRILNLLSAASQPSVVRRQAERELASLR